MNVYLIPIKDMPHFNSKDITFMWSKEGNGRGGFSIAPLSSCIRDSKRPFSTRGESSTLKQDYPNMLNCSWNSSYIYIYIYIYIIRKKEILTSNIERKGSPGQLAELGHTH